MILDSGTMEPLFNNAISNAVGTVLGGLFLSLVYYLVRDRLFSLPDISGSWVFETLTVRSAYHPYIDMRLRFLVLLTQEGNRISGTGEKTLEISENGWRPFVGKHRARMTITGVINKYYRKPDQITVHYAEEGEKRDSSTLHQLQCRASNGTMILVGTFTSTVADTAGITTWSRTAVGDPLLIARSSLVARSFRSLLVTVSQRFYATDWNNLVPEVRREYDNYLRLQQAVDFFPLIRVLIAGEDRRFGRHVGIDLKGIARAIWRMLKSRQVQGASTIEQQLVRILTKDYRRTVARKLKEIILALRLSAVVPKRDIPGIYICRAYYGWRMNGLLQAANRLSIDLTRIDYAHAAQIIARIKCPEPQHPSSDITARIQTRVRHLVAVTTQYAAQLKTPTR